MANDTSTSLAARFKYVQRNFMADDTAKAAGPLAEMIRSKAKKIFAGGKNLDATWSWKKYPGVGVKVLTDGGDFATPAASAWATPVLALKHYSYAVGVTGHAEAMGSGPEASFAQKKILTEKTEEIRNKAASYMARFLMADGTQTTWGKVTSVSSNVITLEESSPHFFKEGEVLGGYDATADTDTTDKFTDGTVLEVDHQNGKVEVTNIGTVVAGDFLAVKALRGTTPPNGIRNLFAIATGTVHGINRATAGNHFMEPNVVTLSGAMTGTMIDQVRDLVGEVGGQRSTSYNSTFVMHPTVRRWATLATIGQNRFADMKNLQLGNAGMKVADRDGIKEFIEDPYCRTGEVFVIDPTACVLAYPQGMEGGYFVEAPGGDIFHQQTAASGAGYADATLMYYVQRWNLGCDNFRVQGYGSGFVSP